uniref:Uncharacterized protein n=1 Tax=Myripristis murdjan TaxID=586833 RepID=A0A667X4K7_9TELE
IRGGNGGCFERETACKTDFRKFAGKLSHNTMKSQAVSCPLVDGLYLQETDSMLELLCTPSQHRSDILAWICCRYLQQLLSVINCTPVVVCCCCYIHTEMARLGQELMLCKADDLDLIVVSVKPL